MLNLEIDIEWTPESVTLVELAEKNSLSPAFSCRTGLCSICASRIQCGTVGYTEEPTAHFAENEVLTCGSIQRSLSGKQTRSDDMGVVWDL